MRHQILSYDLLPQELSGSGPDQPDYRYDAMRRALRLAMRQELTQRQRECLERRLAGQRVKDIAAALGITSPTVSKHLQRAACRLQHALRYSCFIPSD
ncbi:MULTISPECIES: LuxR C-terminal-related transcriptional regulator [Caproicibacterium]|uniref:LuxR C-terminal-related transcriptional regulator n=1 Tax=Caproicibacterium argilliputei TaxID=3030016 RepID=A0AA97DB56_9FIRM|nr:LuxR C-terminal-related transcriptional regulator [Caproicibacterium argilliputei]WOC32211.1 LuxR C-terminal-related transcriptional regulator [Caproicibacterium argilliputei]